MKPIVLLRSLLAAALLLASMAASAHRFHAGIVDIAFNPRSGSTEVVHTYMAHDIDALLANLYGRHFDLSDPEDQEALRKYMEPRFRLHGADKARLPLRWVGMTVDPERVVVYQEAERTPLQAVSVIHNSVLTDFLPDQVNTVNLDAGAGVRTLSFDRSKPEQPIH